MLDKLHCLWLRMQMSHSLDLEAAYWRAIAQHNEAIKIATLRGKDPQASIAKRTLYQKLVARESELQSGYRRQLISLGYRPEMLV